MPFAITKINRAHTGLLWGRGAFVFNIPTVPAAIPAAPISAPVIFSGSDDAETTATVDFGSDIGTFPDLDDSMTPDDDPKLLAQALLRRFTTPRGMLSFHPNYGTDIRMYLNESIDDDILFRMKAALEIEAEQDERVESCEVSITYQEATRRLVVSIAIETAAGPFRFLLEADELTANIIVEEEV